MRVALLGSKGQLGRELARTCPATHELMGWDLPELDICDYAALSREMQAYRPQLVINAAAYTDVERAESEPETAFACNEYGARNAAAAAAACKAPVVYYSTDFVFDGLSEAPYEETDAPNPLSVYGKSKLAGEQAVRAATPCHFILRTAWLYGPGGNNFVEKMLRLAESHECVRVVDNETGSPTHTWDLAQATWRLCDTEAFGLYHAVNAGACTRYEMAKALFQLAGLTVETIPVPAGTFGEKAARPARAALAAELLERRTGVPMRPWRAALEHYLLRRKAAPA